MWLSRPYSWGSTIAGRGADRRCCSRRRGSAARSSRPCAMGLPQRKARFAHVEAIEETGVGESALLEGMALQDLASGNGFALIDPHGDLAERIASRIPEHRRDDLIYLNAADRSLGWGYNPLRHVQPHLFQHFH